MPEFQILNRSALGDRPARLFQDVRITAIAESIVLHIQGKPGNRQLADTLSKTPCEPALVSRSAGPGQWYLVGDGSLTRDELAAIRNALEPHASVSDQSHGRIRIRVEGPMVERVLAKGTAVDLDIGAFPVGHCAATLCGHIGCHLTRTEENAFELLVLRGFAESLWDDLMGMAAEFA